MRVAVFGGTGLVGAAIVKLLVQQGHDVISISRSGKSNVARSINLDIVESDNFSRIDFVPDVVINCASMIPQRGKTSTDPSFVEMMQKVNVVGALNIANWAVAQKAGKIINYSTLVTVKKPWPAPLLESYASTPDGFHVAYSMSKLSQEQLMTQAVNGTGTSIVHLRLGAVYGNEMTRDGILFSLFDQLSTNELVKLTNGNKVSFDFIHTQDIAAITALIMDSGISSGIYNCGSSEETYLYPLAKLVKEITQSKSTIDNVDELENENRASIDISKLLNAINLNASELTSLKTGLTQLFNIKSA
ncbi:Nucleoside-diphosphate-sugar epimerase [Nonlabens sp. Hel1_33_55]|uniref:NAD-dependent epimerase/dehydratase family protein n=1 Tax=Nonlabens sp. Hel1_33_55 TaxID=1336802 RepID=UPI000875B743|nr:NAD(P)-dependent oxidoreductase [Nonlabens sp. Hel1_33_55]SCX94646.1 Nucleoside-diphosphate-sugar epimerase [Nonlabens sp. Hel1_33_55]